MSRAGKLIVAMLCIIVIVALAFIVAYTWAPEFRAVVNAQLYNVQTADDATSYATRRQVEDTARAMISSYEADVLMYEQYRNSSSAEQQSWAEQARIRANRTAATYNNYMLKNSYIWAGNIPTDIYATLPTI